MPSPLPPGGPAPELDRALPVLLLRTDRNPFHHGTLGAIRSLGSAGVPVHAILEGRATPAARSRHLHRRHPWGPSPAREPDALAEHLRHIAGRIGCRTLLIPLDDAGAIFIAEQAPALAECFASPVFPSRDPHGPRRVADKSTLLRECARHGIDHPDSRVPGSRAEVDEAIAALGLPLVVKWPRPWLLPPGRRGTAVVRSVSEIHRLCARTGPDGPGDLAPGPPILQRHIPPDGGDWFFHGHFDHDHGRLFGGTGRKHLAHPPEAGLTVSGEWVRNEPLERLACGIVGTLGHVGTVDLDFRFDPRTGIYHLLDFNPRLGAQFRLFRDERGLDLARIVHLQQSGRAVPQVRPRYGRTLLVEHHFLRHALTGSGARAGALGRAWPRLREAGELAWFAADDPAPFLAMGRRGLVRALRRTT